MSFSPPAAGSPPAGSPPPTSSPSTYGSKRPISLPNTPPRSHKKHKASRKSSLVPGTLNGPHPLRQTSFPPDEGRAAGTARRNRRSPSIDSDYGLIGGRRVGRAQSTDTSVDPQSQSQDATGAEAGEDDEDEDKGDDYGTTSLLADGSGGGFAEDDEKKMRIATLIEHFDPDQLNRYEAYKRSNLNKGSVKKIANQVLSQSVTANVGTVIGGFAKVYVCDIIQSALEIQKQWGDSGPLLPDHLREAARRYRVENRGAVGNRYIGGTHNGPGPGPGDAIGGGVTRLFR